MASPLFHWRLNSANIGLDSSGSNNDLTATDVTLVTDSVLGPVASFGPTSSLSTTSSSINISSPTTYAAWLKLPNEVAAKAVFSNTDDFQLSVRLTDGATFYNYRGPGSSGAGIVRPEFVTDVWEHFAASFDGGTLRVYRNGVEGGSASIVLNANPFDLVIGHHVANDQRFDGGFMSDFRVYNSVLSAAEILAVSQEYGPPIPPLSVEPRAINIPVEFEAIAGATQYQITYEGPSGGEIVAVSGSTDLTYNIVGVEPNTQYTIKLYADTGTGLELAEELATTTLPNVAINYDITEFQDTNGVTDLTSLDAASLSNMSAVFTDLVDTGDVVNVSVPSNPDFTTTFVDLGGTIGITEIDGVFLPFEDTSGTGQTVDLTLSDNTTVPIAYDEGSNTITVESVTYSTGDVFALDGNAIEVVDFYGLTLLDVNELIPLTLEPRPVNIPVVIGDVPGAIGYNVTYEGPTGGEITALSGVTALEQNITGLVAETEYTVRLYADTGSGYQLTQELITTTLPNDAANYDVTDFQQDGVIKLSSLPKDTISNIGEVMNELFNTGDIVNVSVQGKSEVNTSFIKLGETLSIQELDGVLLPFVEASTPGQDVNVVLSDGSTTVAIDYDETVNNIVVNGVVYYPGDSFILDGQKVTVVEY